MNNYVQSLNNRSTNPHQLEVLFRQKLSQNQIFYICEILRILSLYIVLNRKMLDFYAGYHIGLSYLQRAVRYGLIAEYACEGNDHIYQLGAAGVYYVAKLHLTANILPLNSTKEDRDRILIANEYMIKNNLALCTNIPITSSYDYFLSKSKVGKLSVCFFPDFISQNEIRNTLQKTKKINKDSDIDFVELDYDYRINPELESNELSLANDDMEVSYNG